MIAADLSTLIAVSKHGGVRGAAAHLNRSQPAVTQAIQRLERTLGLRLVDRSGYRLQLTPEGRLIVKKAAPHLRGFADIRALASNLARGVEERVRICVHGALETGQWCAILEASSTRFPDTVMVVAARESDGPWLSLCEMECDLAVTIGDSATRFADSVETRRIGSTTFVRVASARQDPVDQHGGPNHGPQIVVSDFSSDSTEYGVHFDHPHWYVSSHAIKAELIRQRLGWGSVPLYLVADDLAAGRLVHVDETLPAIEHDVFLARLKDRPAGPVASLIWEMAVRIPPP